jgi:serine/threonine kinase 16
MEQGGFSYVYLVEDSATHELFALKKIRCPFGQESVSLALKEVEAYALFSPHPNIIHAIDHSVASDRSDPAAKTVYILLPYYRRGNLQDMINANLVNHTKFPEKRLMQLFLGVCKALKAMHQYKVKGGPGGGRSAAKARRVREEAAAADRDAAQAAGAEDDDEAAEPLMEAGDEITRSQDGIAPGQPRAYAHRDIKPGKILDMIH